MKKLGLILFILIIVYFIFLIRQDIIDNLELKREGQRISETIKKGKKLTQELQNKLRALNNPAYVEELARSRLGLIKRGETAYKVIQD